MPRITEYKDDQFMINVTKSEALLLIRSLAIQINNDDCNRDRVEFGKRHKDDAEYFSIAVDESITKFHVMTNLINGEPINDIIVNCFDTLKEAQDFIIELNIRNDGIMKENMWIKEVRK